MGADSEGTKAPAAETPTVVNPVKGDGAALAPAPAATAAAFAAEDLARVKGWITRANPDVVPELIVGTTPAELEASIGPAREAFKNALARAGVGAAAGAGGAAAPGSLGVVPVAAPVVPAGATVAVVNPDALPTSEKIRRGLAARNRS